MRLPGAVDRAGARRRRVTRTVSPMPSMITMADGAPSSAMAWSASSRAAASVLPALARASSACGRRSIWSICRPPPARRRRACTTAATATSGDERARGRGSTTASAMAEDARSPSAGERERAGGWPARCARRRVVSIASPLSACLREFTAHRPGSRRAGSMARLGHSRLVTPEWPADLRAGRRGRRAGRRRRPRPRRRPPAATCRRGRGAARCARRSPTSGMPAGAIFRVRLGLVLAPGVVVRDRPRAGRAGRGRAVKAPPRGSTIGSHSTMRAGRRAGQDGAAAARRRRARPTPGCPSAPSAGASASCRPGR